MFDKKVREGIESLRFEIVRLQTDIQVLAKRDDGYSKDVRDLNQIIGRMYAYCDSVAGGDMCGKLGLRHDDLRIATPFDILEAFRKVVDVALNRLYEIESLRQERDELKRLVAKYSEKLAEPTKDSN